MSERGYDSDAQYITTPRCELGSSPAGRALRRMELSDLIEQSQEREEAERWALSNEATDSQESAFGMRFIPTPPGTLRGSPTTFHTARDTDDSKYQPLVHSPLRIEQSQGSPVLDKILGGSLPSFSPTHDPGATNFQHSPVLNVPENASGWDLMSDWKQFMKSSRDRYGVGSSGSLPAPSADLVVSKTRQPSNSARSFTDPRDPRAIHLSELGISNRLAVFSQSSQEGSCNPSSTDLFYKKRGAIGGFSQENVQFCQSGNSTISGNEPPRNPNGQRDASSCYSKASPSSGSLSIGGLSFKKLICKTMDPKPKPALQNILTSDSGAVNVPAPRNTLLSKFQEHCDSGSSDSHQFESHPSGIISPRKLSVGWMSGGRRVGYGYNPVPGKEGSSPKKDNQSPPQLSQVSGLKAEYTTTNGAHDSPSNYDQLEKMTQSSPREYSTTSPSHPRPPLYEALTGPRSIKSAKSNIGFTAPPHFRAFLNRSSQSQNLITGSSESVSRVLCAPELTPTVQPELCQISLTAHVTSLGQGKDTIASQWARLSRSMNRKSQSQDRKSGPDGITNAERLQEIVFGDGSDETEPGFLGTEHHDESEDQAQELQPNLSRVTRWANRFSRYRESRRPMTARQQGHSQSSSGGYQDCESASISLKRATSTKSNTTDDPDHFEMPGSFEGSRWASRLSRLL